MLRFIFYRLLQTIPVLLIIATMTFFLLHLAPGGPFSAEKKVNPEVLKSLEKHYGLNKSLPAQYLDYLGKLLHGDLGPSFKYANRSVNELIAQGFPVSLELGSYAILIATVLGCILCFQK